MISNGTMNTVGIICIHYPIIQFTFFNQKITLFESACLMNVLSLQAVEMSTTITHCCQIQFQVINP